MAKGGQGVVKHIHRYMKNQYGLWVCALDGCTHFIPSNIANSIIGRISVCWNCGDEFKLNPLNMQDEKPKCDDCSGINDLDKFLQNKGIS